LEKKKKNEQDKLNRQLEKERKRQASQEGGKRCKEKLHRSLKRLELLP